MFAGDALVMFANASRATQMQLCRVVSDCFERGADRNRTLPTRYGMCRRATRWGPRVQSPREPVGRSCSRSAGRLDKGSRSMMMRYRELRLPNDGTITENYYRLVGKSC